MAAVTTDIPLCWRSARPTRLPVAVPEIPAGGRRGSVRLVTVPPSAEVRRSAPAPIAPGPIAGAALLPSRLAGPVRVAPAAYRLRRMMAMAIVVGLVLTTWLGLEALVGALGVSGSAASASTAAPPATIVVAPGDTFWSIASRIQPQGDPRPLIDRLVAAHGGGVLQAGDHLSLPRR